MGLKCYSWDVIREDFVQKVKFELDIEEWWEFWGMAFQLERGHEVAWKD